MRVKESIRGSRRKEKGKKKDIFASRSGSSLSLGDETRVEVEEAFGNFVCGKGFCTVCVTYGSGGWLAQGYPARGVSQRLVYSNPLARHYLTTTPLPSCVS